MNPPSSLFLLLPSITFVSCHLPPGYHTSRELKEEKEIFGTGVQDRQPRSVSTLKVLDFSDDNDQKRDSNDSVTGASLKVGSLPESFTVCSAMMVEPWTTEFSAARMFTLAYPDGGTWGKIDLYAADGKKNQRRKSRDNSNRLQRDISNCLLPPPMDTSLPLPGLDCKQGETGGGRAAAWGGRVQEGGG